MYPQPIKTKKAAGRPSKVTDEQIISICNDKTSSLSELQFKYQIHKGVISAYRRAWQLSSVAVRS